MTDWYQIRHQAVNTRIGLAVSDLTPVFAVVPGQGLALSPENRGSWRQYGPLARPQWSFPALGCSPWETTPSRSLTRSRVNRPNFTQGRRFWYTHFLMAAGVQESISAACFTVSNGSIS